MPTNGLTRIYFSWRKTSTDQQLKRLMLGTDNLDLAGVDFTVQDKTGPCGSCSLGRRLPVW